MKYLFHIKKSSKCFLAEILLFSFFLFLFIFFYTSWEIIADQAIISDLLQQQANEDSRIQLVIYLKDTVSSDIAHNVKEIWEPLIEDEATKLRGLLPVPTPTKIFQTREEMLEYVKDPENLFPVLSESEKEEVKHLKQKIDDLRTQMHNELIERIKSAMAPKLSIVTNLIEEKGGQVLKKSDTGTIIKAEIPSTSLDEIASLSCIEKLDAVIKAQTFLNISVPKIYTYMFWNDPNQFTGGFTSVDVGIVDSGIDPNHPALQAHNFIHSITLDPNIFFHGTHVAGIIASTDSTYRGMAYGLDTILDAFAYDQGDVMDSLDWCFAQTETPEAINLSMGFNPLSDYDYIAQHYDRRIEQHGVLAAIAGGNYQVYPIWYPPLDPWDDVVKSPATCYNGLAVGAVNDKNSLSYANQVIADLSIRGPTLGLRKKPDIVAPGENIISLNSFWETGPDYLELSCTSMASPHVAGAILLLADAGVSNHMAQKAILINSATTWSDGGTPYDPNDDYCAPNISQWNACYGWGSLNMNAAYFGRDNCFYGTGANNIRIYQRSSYSGKKSFQFFKMNAIQGHTHITLVWDRHYGATRLNNLDLAVYLEESNSLVGISNSNKDNVEQLTPNVQVQTSNALIKVYTQDQNFSAVSYEKYALAADSFYMSKKDGIDLDTTAVSGWIWKCYWFYMPASVKNDGDCIAHDVKVTLNIDFDIIGDKTQDIGDLLPDQTKNVEWLVIASCTPGYYDFNVTSESNSYGEIFSDVDYGTVWVRNY